MDVDSKQSKLSRLSPLNLIGNTPLIELRSYRSERGVRIFAKLEGQNPSGSIKDRVALALIEAAEAEGRLKPGSRIVEASSGNTGISLSMIALQKGYEAHVVIPTHVPDIIGDILDLLGAEIHWCEAHAGMKGAILAAQKLADEMDAVCLGQFTSPANTLVHVNTTGPEICAALDRIDVFVAGIGTGGTIMGVSQALKVEHPNLRVVGVEPQPGERLQGLTNLKDAYQPPLLDLNGLNRRLMVNTAQALQATKELAAREGILAGVSSGATLCAALKEADNMSEGNIVIMFSDGGWKYLPARPWDAAEHGDHSLDELHWW